MLRRKDSAHRDHISMWVNKNLVFFYLKLIEVKHLSKLMKNNFFVGVVAASECPSVVLILNYDVCFF